MAKKRSSRRRFSLRRVRVTPAVALSTLAQAVAIVVNVTPASTSTYRCMSIKGVISLTDLTANEGPIVVGYAHSDYSVTEIKEALEASNAIDVGDKIANEKANRLVRVVGTMNEVRESLNDGRPITTKLNWLMSIGDSVNLFAYNDGPALLTTNAIVSLAGDMWVKDSA